jgi:hypothetical protein
MADTKLNGALGDNFSAFPSPLVKSVQTFSKLRRNNMNIADSVTKISIESFYLRFTSLNKNCDKLEWQKNMKEKTNKIRVTI